jgi:hypothetical protein
MRFIIVELQTMICLTHPELNDENNKKKAGYTIETLDLNRDYLVDARKEAYQSYLDALTVYVALKSSGASTQALLDKKVEIQTRQHPTVWHEMKRQHSFHPQLLDLFQQANELI